MSGFFGIFNPSGTGIDLGAFEQMKKSADCPGHDVIETYISDNIAIGHVMLRVSSESQFDQQPLKSSCGNYILVGHFRLDYRDELGDKLGLTQLELNKTPDSKLVMNAYQKWKERCVHHLEGDWVFFIYNKESNSIEVYKDSTGISAFFYFSSNSCFYFASDPANILNDKSLDFKINLHEFEKLSIPGRYFAEGCSLVEDLEYLKVREMLSVSSNLDIKKSVYDAINKSTVRFHHETDYVHDFLLLYFKSVKNRLITDQSNGIFLSGGLDSSSVASLSSLLLQKASGRIVAFTSVPEEKFQLAESENMMLDESPLVKLLKEMHPKIELNFNSFPDADVLSDLKDFVEKNAFYPVITKNSYWLSGFMSQGAKEGVKNFITGQGGNYTTTWSGSNYYLDLLMNFKFRDLYINLRSEFGKSNNKYLTLKSIILVPAFIYFNLFFDKVFSLKYHKKNPFINSQKKHFQILYTELKYRFQVIKSHLLDYESNKLILQSSVFSFIGIWWYLLSNKYHVQVVDPTTDSRLVNYLNSIPQSLFFRESTRKYIFRKAMIGYLPYEILHNKKTQLQSSDFEFKFSSYFRNLLIEGRKNDNFFFSTFNSTSMENAKMKLCENPDKMYQKLIVNHFLHAFSLQKFCLSVKNVKFANIKFDNEAKS